VEEGGERERRAWLMAARRYLPSLDDPSEDRLHADVSTASARVWQRRIGAVHQRFLLTATDRNMSKHRASISSCGATIRKPLCGCSQHQRLAHDASGAPQL